MSGPRQTTIDGHGLGWVKSTDPRNGNYPLRAAIPPEATQIAARTWYAPPALDQGSKPHCVGYSGRHVLNASPIITRGGPDADTLYFEARKRDEWSGENYDGTSALGLMRYLSEIGIVTEYRWSESAADALDFVLGVGPLLLGCLWTRDMSRPDRHGVIRPTGAEEGGHELVIIGGNRRQGRFRLLNSWGGTWCQGGRCWLLGEDLERLLERRADICKPFEAAQGRV